MEGRRHIYYPFNVMLMRLLPGIVEHENEIHLDSTYYPIVHFF
jgi:hypothetical protein